MRGKFITFEGIDGSGKSTQIRMLASELRGRGMDPISTCEPGGTPLGRHLRQAFLETEETVAPLAELLLFAADRAQHVEFLIKPSLAAGRIVLSDRYADATTAYQGAGRGFGPKTVEQIIGLATGGLKPDMTLFFDITVESAMSRMNVRPETETRRNRMDDETADFYARVREKYLEIARNEPDRFLVIKAEGSIQEIHEQVMKTVTKLIG